MTEKSKRDEKNGKRVSRRDEKNDREDQKG